MLLLNQHPHNKSIMCSVMGAPNVGKSSLINHLLGTDLAIVSPRPQTTRNSFHCVFTIDLTEIILVDTPGLHHSSKDFNQRINESAREGSEGADINLLLIELTRPVLEQFQNFKDLYQRPLQPVWAVFTKSDAIENAQELPLSLVMDKAKEIIPELAKHFLISSKTGEGIEQLTGAILDEAKPGPHLYPRGDLSNKNSRFFVAEYIREEAFRLLRDELPYELAVLVDRFVETEKGTNVSANILVNRPSQRAIVIGQKGTMIKEIGTRARQKLKDLLGEEVHLNLHVKVAPHWSNNNFILEEIGLPRSNTMARGWKKK